MAQPASTTPRSDLHGEFDAVDQIEDTYAAANAVFDRLKRTRRLDLLRPVLVDALTYYRRNQVRATEHAVRTEAKSTKRQRKVTAVSGKTIVHLPSLNDLLAQRFFNGSKWVTYAAATVTDYDLSIAFLQRNADGIAQTIAFRTACRDAIAAQRGATTLADVPDTEVAAVMAGMP